MDTLRKRLAAFPKQAFQAAKRAAWEAAEETKERAREAVPVKTGKLKNSIAVHEKEACTEVKTDCPYGGMVEMGTRNHPARPFLLPAAYQTPYGVLAAQAWKEAFK